MTINTPIPIEEQSDDAFELPTLPDGIAQRTRRDYVCSQCWGELVLVIASDRQWKVVCGTCRDETKGYVRRNYADNRRSASKGEALEVARMMEAIGLLEKRRGEKTATQLLSELGF